MSLPNRRFYPSHAESFFRHGIADSALGLPVVSYEAGENLFVENVQQA